MGSYKWMNGTRKVLLTCLWLYITSLTILKAPLCRSNLSILRTCRNLRNLLTKNLRNYGFKTSCEVNKSTMQFSYVHWIRNFWSLENFNYSESPGVTTSIASWLNKPAYTLTYYTIFQLFQNVKYKYDHDFTCSALRRILKI